MPASLSCAHLSFAWPGGRALLQDAGADFTPGLNGLIGLNGTGKSTLLQMLRGGQAQASGSVDRPGSVGYLPQDLTLNSALRVDEVLGIAGVRAVLRRIDDGLAGPDDLDEVAEQWDVEERALAELSRFGFGGLALDREIGTLSAGEVVLLALAALFLAGHRMLLLDEPTNNLDLVARNRLYDVVQASSGVVVVVSHDHELLERCDQIVELRDLKLRSTAETSGLRAGGGARAERGRAVGAQRGVRPASAASRADPEPDHTGPTAAIRSESLPREAPAASEGPSSGWRRPSAGSATTIGSTSISWPQGCMPGVSC